MARGIKPIAQISKKAYGIQTIDRFVAIMQLLAESEIPIDFMDVADATGLNRTTAHRYMLCLTRHRLIQRTVKGRYLCAPELERFFTKGRRAAAAVDREDAK